MGLISQQVPPRDELVIRRQEVFEMFGLGMQEVAILIVLGVLLVGAPIVIICLILFLKRGQSGGRIAELEEENRRLRDQLGKS